MPRKAQSGSANQHAREPKPAREPKSARKAARTPEHAPRSLKAERRKPGVRAAKPARARKVDTATRRQAIVDAALSVFAENGFGAARLDDVAQRAGVAKGTLYLYFEDKETLFEAVIRNAVTPLIERLEALAAAPALPFEAALEAFSAMFEKEVLGTKRKLVARLVISEGPRFPRIAQFHYRNVVAPIMALISKLAERALARGEISSDVLVRFPQLLAAPLLTALIWDGLFSSFKPLDVAGFFKAHRQLLLAVPRKKTT
jgi:AcrR family transcriptional regulator